MFISRSLTIEAEGELEIESLLWGQASELGGCEPGSIHLCKYTKVPLFLPLESLFCDLLIPTLKQTNEFLSLPAFCCQLNLNQVL